VVDRRGAAGVLTAAMLWGTLGTAQELGAPDASPLTVAGMRSLAGGLLLLALVVLARRAAHVRAVLTRAPVATLTAAVAITVFQVGYLGGIRIGGVAIGTLLAIGSAPPFAGALSWVGGRPPDRRWFAATLAAVAGASVLLLGGTAVATTPTGVLLGLLAGAAYATYTVASKRVLDRGVAGPPAMAVVFTVSGVLLAPALVVGDLTWVTDPRGLAAVAWLAAGTTALAYSLFAAGLARVDAPTATTLTLAEPLTAAVLAVVVVGERLTGATGIGASLLLVGLATTAWRPARSPVRPAPTRDGNDH
jgi:drug/metabolite transporter, DME family